MYLPSPLSYLSECMCTVPQCTQYRLCSCMTPRSYSLLGSGGVHLWLVFQHSIATTASSIQRLEKYIKLCSKCISSLADTHSEQMTPYSPSVNRNGIEKRPSRLSTTIHVGIDFIPPTHSWKLLLHIFLFFDEFSPMWNPYKKRKKLDEG